MSAGLFILSLDTEIAWGAYNADQLRRDAACFDRYRETIPRLIALLDRYQIPATWALVGHLLLDQCSGHPELPQPHYGWANVPDSERDPRSDRARAPWYYAPDVVAQIQAATTKHEIGTHTFTHLIADDPAVSAAMWAAQLRACAALHAERGLTMRSLVYPLNRVAYVEQLPDYGIVAYRGPERRPKYRLSWAADRALPFTPPTYTPDTLVEPIGHQRLVNLPASQFLIARLKGSKIMPARVRVNDAKRGLAQAAQRGELFHLWFHPYNLGLGESMFSGLEQILREVARLRDTGTLRILTMDTAADEILSRAPSVSVLQG